MIAGGDVPISLGSPDGPGRGWAPARRVRYAGTATTATSAGAASLTVMTLDAVEAGAVGELLTPGPGLVDLDLVRDVLAPAEALALPTVQPAFVLVTAGTVDASGTTLGANAGVTVAGSS